MNGNPEYVWTVYGEHGKQAVKTERLINLSL